MDHEPRSLPTYTQADKQIISDDFDIKVKIESILVESTFADSRASKMDIDDLLKLLAGFNVQGM
jgi:18S rRNA (adenine1779-N6/adenine1780-N6)-dimethyltransferase